MEGGVRRNIALKLKDSSGSKQASEPSRRREAAPAPPATAVREPKEEAPPISPAPASAELHDHPQPHKPHPLPPHTITSTSITTDTPHRPSVVVGSNKSSSNKNAPGVNYTKNTTVVGSKKSSSISSSNRNTPVVGSNKIAPEGVLESGPSLRWDHKTNLFGRAVQDPLIHLCEVCSLPVLIYGRMKRCRHAFCRDCAKRAGGVCPRCSEGDQTFEEASMGNVYICTYGGGRYDNKGCGRSYLSQRDLEAHITYRHKDKTQLPVVAPPPGLALSSQSALPTLPMPPFFSMPPAGLPPNFPLPAIPGLPPHPAMTGPRVQPMFPPNLAQVLSSQPPRPPLGAPHPPPGAPPHPPPPPPPVFASQPSSDGSIPGPLPPTWTTTVFK